VVTTGRQAVFQEAEERFDSNRIAQLLKRLDAALDKVTADNSVIDEVLPGIKHRQSEQD